MKGVNGRSWPQVVPATLWCGADPSRAKKEEAAPVTARSRGDLVGQREKARRHRQAERLRLSFNSPLVVRRGIW
jgi:hypothetical protein